MLESYVPLSFSQERIWFLQKLDPDDRSYQYQTTLTFEGALDAAALQRALERIVQRHEIFRTTFSSVAGRPAQVVHPGATAAFELIDLFTGTGASDLPEAARVAIASALARPFDMARLPLVRWTLLRVSPERHVLVHVEHHLVHDGWSFNVFLEEFMQLYRAFATGSEVRLGDAPAFTTFARREREFAETPAAAGQLSYWKRTLAGAPALLGLPTDKRRPAVLSHAGDAVVKDLPSGIRRGIERLAREHAATPFMAMFAAFAVLLQRYSGETDLCIGTGAAGRTSAESEHLIGMIVNTIVLRVDLSGEPSFLELLERVKNVAFDAYANQATPLERVVAAVAPQRDASFNPLFCTLFSFHDSVEPELDFGGVTVTLDRTLNNGSAKVDLNVVCIPHGDGMTLKWEYNSDLFERASMTRMLEHFECLLERIVDEPERRITRFELMREPERRLVLERFAGDTRVPYPRDRTLESLFESVAARSPEAEAIRTDAGSVTYLELDQRANRLARYLRGRGVASETRVALCLERSVDAIVALLAVLKAGGVYVPLDARYPLERIAWLLGDADVALTLTHGSLHERLPHDAAVLRLEQHTAAIAAQSWEPLTEARTAEALAYIMYTSGSTGRPKGVCVTHRGVVRLARSGGSVQFEAADVVLHYSSYAFDGSNVEIWGALLNGAALAIPSGGILSLTELSEKLRQLGVTIAALTAPLVHQIVESRLAGLDSLRLLFSHGDVLSPSHALRFVEGAGRCRLINGYGPTENTTYTTLHEVSRGDAERKSIPIGRPVGNTTVYILDARGLPVPIGVPGHMWTGGDGVARGYLNRPELTAERFVADAFSSEPGATLYRTGDLGRWLPDGSIEFLGRDDGQVKIRGFRIEIGGIESTLRSHPAVRDAAVSVADEPGNERTLIAHVVLETGDATDVRALRSFLGAQLPEYEVPSRIVVLDALPSSVGGKIDRAALALGSPAPAVFPGDGALRGDVEERLGEIWRHVLGAASVSRNDDFFDLGGHSLMAMRALARLNETFEVELSLRELFERRTLAALAEFVARAPRIATPLAIDVTSLTDEEIDALLNDDLAGVAEEF